jgi:benzoyl-CoA reductase/2-hydroxyglutaryl-CoA dehydratase subunit BcrC/BadD/HgdB
MKRMGALENSGRRLMACFPLYPPLELLDSFGYTPVVLWNLKDPAAETPAADLHLQNFTCSVARHLAEFFFSAPEGLFDGLLFYNACDTLRNMPEILQAGTGAGNGGGMPFLRLHVPARWDDEAASHDYLAGEINSLVESLERLAGAPFSPAAFRESSARYARMRRLSLDAASLVRNGRLDYAGFSRTLRDNSFLPVNEQAAKLEALCANASRESASVKKACTPVILSGIIPPPAEVLQFMEGAGLRVVFNDIAAECRSIDNFPGITDDPGAYYADFYRYHFPCTTLLHTAEARVPRLAAAAKESGARGMVFIGEKFCEYEYFEIVHLEKKLKEMNVATLRLEFSPYDSGPYQNLKTRIEAFAEMLG